MTSSTWIFDINGMCFTPMRWLPSINAGATLTPTPADTNVIIVWRLSAYGQSAGFAPAGKLGVAHRAIQMIEQLVRPRQECRAIRTPGSSAPFPNNIIPASLIPAQSTNMLTWKPTSPFAQGGFIAYPNFDAQARAAGSPINLAGTINDTITSNQYLGQGDHRFGDNDRIFARYLIVSGDVVDVPIEQVTRSNVIPRAQNLAVGYTKIISPTVLNDLR